MIIIRRVVFILTGSLPGFVTQANVYIIDYIDYMPASQKVRNFAVNHFRMSYGKQSLVRKRFTEAKTEDLEELLAEMEKVTCS